MKILIYMAHIHNSKLHLYKEALKTIDHDITLVSVYRYGLSSTYRRLAHSTRRKHDNLLTGLHKSTDFDLRIGVCYSAGYGLWSESLKGAREGFELDAIVTIDSWYADRDRDGTAADHNLKDLVEFAKLAKSRKKLLWMGHGDVKVTNYAGTNDVANEVQRLAGGQSGDFYVRSYDVAVSESAEHALALTQWGPRFLTEAVTSLLKQHDDYDPYKD